MPVKNPRPRRKVLKSVIIARLNLAGKLAEAKALLDADPWAFARFFASDRSSIYFDDPDALALLNAIGANPDEIMAP